MNGHSNAPCKGGTTAQGMVIVVELGLLFRGGSGECRSRKSSINILTTTNPGLAPWAMKGVAPAGLYQNKE